MSLVSFAYKAVHRKTVRSFLLVILLLTFLANIFLFFFKLPTRRENPPLSHLHASTPLACPPDCDTWYRRGEALKPPYYLTAVLLVRIYREDLAELTSREMLQWLYYMRYAGVQHVFVYDAYVFANESQYHVLSRLIQSGYVTYVNWSQHNPYTMIGTQVASYRDCVRKHGKDMKWQAVMDMDEYPFSPVDLEPNFMQRFIGNYVTANPEVSQFTLDNYLFLGKPLDRRTNPLLIDRIRRRTHNVANKLSKSIYRTSDLHFVNIHQHDMHNGRSVHCDAGQLRMNHYWGARLQDWGEDTAEILNKTTPDFSIQHIIHRINRCSKCLGADAMYY